MPERVPAIHAETAIKQNPGVLSLVDELVVPDIGSLPDAEQARLKAAIDGARAAVQEHQKWLETELKPKARGDFRIGRELYDQKLSFALMSPLSRQDIRSRAEAEVVRTRSAMYDVARTALAGRPDAPAMPDEPTPDQQQAAIIGRAGAGVRLAARSRRHRRLRTRDAGRDDSPSCARRISCRCRTSRSRSS